MNTTSRKFKIIFNAIGYNLAWWGCVLGAKWSVPWLGPALVLVYLAVHYRYVSRNPREFIFILMVGLIGTVIDSVKSATGFITYREGWFDISWLAPIWITAMWTGFAALLNHSLGWLKGRLPLAFLLGALFGPPSYLGGMNMNVLQFNLPLVSSMLILAAIWGTVMMLLVWITEKMNIEVRYATLTS